MRGQDPLYHAVLQQAWAEGRDIQHGIAYGMIRPMMPWQDLFAAVVHLPWRNGNSQLSSSRGGGAILVRRQSRDPGLSQRVEQGWQGAELALRQIFGPPPTPAGIWLSVVAHWELYSTHYSTASSLWTPAHLRALVQDHPTDCQLTRAEQWLLRHPEFVRGWHPFHEGIGAIRRAPWWGMMSMVPNQAAEQANVDALWAYCGRAPVLGAAVAWATSTTLLTPGPPGTLVKHLITGVHRLAPRYSSLRAQIATLWSRMRYGVPFNEQLQWIAHQAHFYPQDHAVPNFLVQLSALHYGRERWTSTLNNIQEAGWDVMTNAVVVGTLLGLQGTLPSQRLEVLNVGIANTVRHLTGTV